VINKFLHRARHFYRLHIGRDPFLLEVRRWFRDRGDKTLRLDYPLNANSLVVDVGGYRGDFAGAIYKRYGCRVIIFQTVPVLFPTAFRDVPASAILRLLIAVLAAKTVPAHSRRFQIVVVGERES
jgi:hypothetical protein